MTDVKKPENLSPEDLEKPTGGAYISDDTGCYTTFKCPVYGCLQEVQWKGNYAKKTDYKPPICGNHGCDMIIAEVIDLYPGLR